MLKRVCRMEAAMLVRMRVLSLLILVFSSLGIAGDKKKIVLPAYVLKARTVLVLIDPDAGTSMTSPLANKTAQEDVEKALTKSAGWPSKTGVNRPHFINAFST